MRLVPVAAPILGVTSVGEAFMTKVDPVPVWDAMDVALPTDVMGPVRLALVVTVDALPFRLAVMVPAEKFPDVSLTTAVEAVLVVKKAGMYTAFHDDVPVPVIDMHVKIA